MSVGQGGRGGIMRLGRDATRGVTATAQEKRRINNGEEREKMGWNENDLEEGWD